MRGRAVVRIGAGLGDEQRRGEQPERKHQQHEVLKLLGEIALHNIGVLQNGVARRVGTRVGKAHPVSAELPEALINELKPCNAYSIAAATGLPRETVRRKIVRLIELGWIHRRDNGHLFITEGALEEFGTMLSSRALVELLETADHARRLLDQDDK